MHGLRFFQIFIVVSLFFYAGKLCASFFGDHDCCPCTAVPLDEPVHETICYVGAIDFGSMQSPEASEFTVWYGGNSITARDSVFCFRERNCVTRLYYLFVNPKNTKIIDETPLSHLAICPDAACSLYCLEQQTTLNMANEAVVTWRVKPARLAQKTINGEVYTVVPDPQNTLVIPLEESFFAKDAQGAMMWKYHSLKNNDCSVTLPVPITIRDEEKVQDALEEAALAMLDLRSIHPASKCRCACLDRCNMLQADYANS